MQKILKIVTFLFIFVFPLWGRVNIPLNDPEISYDGIWFAQKSAEKVIFNRHTEAFLLNPECGISIYSRLYAYTQTGVKIRFKTKSRNISLSFEDRPDAGKAGLHNAFTVYADGEKYKIFESLNFTITSPKAGSQAVLYEIVLPSLYGVNFTGLSLDDGYELEDISPLNKPVLTVIGTSISHGTGQQSSSADTYPYIIAENMNWELVNLAVAGAFTGWPAAQLVSGKKVDYIIVELGFNDWMWDNKPLLEKESQYTRLIDTLRANQKNAKIFCITPITTTETKSQMAVDFTLDDYREMVRSIVKDRRGKGDKNIFVIHGEDMTSASMLDDGVHLNVKGAEAFGRKMTNRIKKLISSKK
jgi:lysophospholipase L1-like esterase